MFSVALPGTYSQVQLCSQLPQTQYQRLKKEDMYQVGFFSSFFASSDCKHRTGLKTTVESLMGNLMCFDFVRGELFGR